MRANLDLNLNTRFINCKINEVYSISTLLDPRFKEAGFKNESLSNLAISKVTELSLNFFKLTDFCLEERIL